MKRIWKYPLAVTDEQLLSLPVGARILAVEQNPHSASTLDLWALVDPTADDEPRSFAVYGTGNPVPDEPGRHLATIQGHRSLVWHVFEDTP